MMNPIDKSKQDTIRKHYIQRTLNMAQLAKELGTTRKTIAIYVKELRIIEKKYPRKLRNTNFWLPKVHKPYKKSERYIQLLELLPVLVDTAKTNKLSLIPLWEEYKKIYPDGFCLDRFTKCFIEWRRKENICLFTHRRVKHICPEDMAVLTKWINAFDHKKWERATVILESSKGTGVLELQQRLGRTEIAILRWIDSYKERGIDGLLDKPYTMNEERVKQIETRQNNIVKILHETPALHGFNRSSWRLQDLSTAYLKTYGEPYSTCSISVHLERMGYKYAKSREVLTSPDTYFREKLNHIKDILSQLGPSEKFFSVDELGHFSVKCKGGRTFVKEGEEVVIPQLQKSKGALLVTAALELSTNQITHLYAKHKSTEEMIRLIEALMKQYQNASKLYITWDAASWHTSKRLKEYLVKINEDGYRKANNNPPVELAPLPSSAQFLNVIESVFSGLAKAVIHNSNYQSVEECMAAIDLHFENRNAYYRENPRKAGNSIWGKERVKPVFDEANNCKYLNNK